MHCAWWRRSLAISMAGGRHSFGTDNMHLSMNHFNRAEPPSGLISGIVNIPVPNGTDMKCIALWAGNSQHQ